MAKFPTTGVLSVSTGVLMGDIREVYDVISFLVGRRVYTHELPEYSLRAAAVIKHHEGIPDEIDAAGWEATRDRVIAAFGDQIEFSDHLRGCLDDGKDPIATLGAFLSGEVR